MHVISERGFLIVAANTSEVDYVLCAEKLADSLRFWHPDIPICLLTDKIIDNKKFDYIKIFPHGDQSHDKKWKLSNDWQVWSASPFRQTIKLEADMLLTSSIDHWWYLLQKKDLVISLGARDFYNQSAKSRYYRKVFDENNLPDVYNAITYWRLSSLAQTFFRLVRNIFEQWKMISQLLKFADKEPTTDLVYALAAQIIGPDQVTLPHLVFFKIVHMKKHIIPITGNDWTKELIWEFDKNQLRINTVAQQGFFHYNIKDWVNKIEPFR